MEIMEIVLLIAGGVIFILSFLIPGGKETTSGQSAEQAKKEISDMVGAEMEKVRGHVDDVVDEAVTYATEKTERALERLTNEKIMAVNEYSDTVLAEIHKNHEEAMFLYDMLNNKHVNLKNTVSEVNRTVKEAEEAVSGFRALTPEAPESGQSTGTVQYTEKAASQEQSAKEAEAPAHDEQKQAYGEEETGKAETTDTEPVERVSFLQEDQADGRNSNERILELYKQGKSKVAIAKELGLGVGEVKLVIDLFKNQ